MKPEIQLRNCDPDDVYDVLLKVELSYGINFDDNELAHIKTFGEMCDYIANKIDLASAESCTSQQAFYKLKGILTSPGLGCDDEITPSSPIAEILPASKRRSSIRKIEKELGFKLHILEPPGWSVFLFMIIFLSSLVTLLFSLKVGVAGVLLSIAGQKLSALWGNRLTVQTIGDIAEKMTREHYQLSRRDSKTFNKKEVREVLTDLFAHELSLDKSVLHTDAVF